MEKHTPDEDEADLLVVSQSCLPSSRPRGVSDRSALQVLPAAHRRPAP